MSTPEELNHEVIVKHDPAAAKIFFTSKICEVYRFIVEDGKWSQIDCKGTLFLYSRVSNDGYPYAVTVLNRQNDNDFRVFVSPNAITASSGKPTMEVALNESLVIIKSSPEELWGLWLFIEEDRGPLKSLLEWCIENGSAGDESA